MTIHARAILHDLVKPENLLDGPHLTPRWFALLAFLLLLAVPLMAADYNGNVVGDGET
ncbi:MAG: hypothetical protein MZV65_33320 [Chromatiales bacterium]|nr:hypothetical protein [Chromatiales bacterium]